MKTKIFAAAIGLALGVNAYAQNLKPQNLKDFPVAAISTKPSFASDFSDKKETKPKDETANEAESFGRKMTENEAQTSSNGTYVRPSAERRFKRYVNGIFGPVAIAKNVAYAGIGTWRNSPEEWGDKWEGFGRRVASNFGRGAVKNTTMYALDEALKLDSGFYRSRKKDMGSRVKNALLSTVTARRPSGKRTIGVPRIVATYTTSIIAYETWYPRRYDYKDGLRSGTISLGFNAAFNLVKEFIRKK
jgi:hypothetical protein